MQKASEQQVLEGSGLIVPKRHAVDVFSLTPEEWQDTQELLLKAKAYLEEKYEHEGYSVGWNTGEVGGQSIPHAHLHVIPRFADEAFAGKGIRYWIKQKENSRGAMSTKL
ncbi:HIT family protein [Sporosarcina thermotolerans]|uniref:HIT family protein n=1 Tax=Sporosarcina thermotolerans TaxID=633404 RepID=UPI00321A817B